MDEPVVDAQAFHDDSLGIESDQTNREKEEKFTDGTCVISQGAVDEPPSYRKIFFIFLVQFRLL